MQNRELDNFLAIHVMGWELIQQKGLLSWWADKTGSICRHYENWHPTTSISDAFQVVEKMRVTHFKWFEMAHRPNGYTCNFSGDPRHTVFAETAPLAICLAAKEAIEKKGE